MRVRHPRISGPRQWHGDCHRFHMLDKERLISGLHDQLGRLSCREIEMTASTDCLDGLFHRNGQTIQLPLSIALRRLFPLLARSGDELVWRVLEEHAQRPE